MVSHDPRVIETFCGRALLLEGGRILTVGAGPEVVARYHSLLQRSHTGAQSELVPAQAAGDLRGSISVP
jgi:ABC-type polysaccharide/polyol phosphate transport system ATPase subunit